MKIWEYFYGGLFGVQLFFIVQGVIWMFYGANSSVPVFSGIMTIIFVGVIEYLMLYIFSRAWKYETKNENSSFLGLFGDKE